MTKPLTLAGLGLAKAWTVDELKLPAHTSLS